MDEDLLSIKGSIIILLLNRHLNSCFYLVSQYSASLNCCGLLYFVRCSCPIILSLYVEYSFIIRSVYAIRAYMSKIIAIHIATDISSMEVSVVVHVLIL
jgi:hypothetical protein